MVVVFGVGGYIVNNLQTQFGKNKTQQDIESKMAVPLPVTIEPIQPADEDTSKKTYAGKVLAGRNSPYLVFKQVDYEKAQSFGKIIFLDFYANWSPLCRGEAPYLIAGFSELTSDKVVGFQVNYSDSDTDQDEKKLAIEFNVYTENTKIILKGGSEVLRSQEAWDKKRFLQEMQTLLQNN